MKVKTHTSGLSRKLLSLGLVLAIVFGCLSSGMVSNIRVAEAAGSTITSMNYFSASDGPVISGSGVGSASYGFVMPIFNGGAATWEDVVGDLTVNVKVNGRWVNIDDTSFVYNQNWGHWHDGGFTGYWFIVSETTYLQLASKSNGVTLDYTLEFTNIGTAKVSSMSVTQGPELTADATGGVGFTHPIFNGDAEIPYAAVAEDLKLYVKPINSNEWINIDNNPASGWIYDNNFGHFYDGPGGFWFRIDESINVKLEAISSGASVTYTLLYNEQVRNSFNLSPYDGTTNYKADESGAVGIPLPKIDGTPALNKDLDAFVYEIKMNGEWVQLSDYSKSGFSYSGNGYNKYSDKNQWGYWVDYIYGLWFQPIQVDVELRIGFPLNGQKGGAIGNNYVTYTFVGNPNATRPDLDDYGDIVLGSPDDPHLAGNTLVWHDEFDGNSLDTSVWNYETGYYLDDNPGTWGWGNAELQWYSNSDRNVFVRDGKLNLKAYQEAKSFPQDPSRYAQYSSGKITTQNKFAFKYGRIDFRAKLPVGNGLWPALWMMPNDNVYGTWAASGEIDVMEARGRIPGSTSGALHFGGTWPANTYIGSDYAFPDGQRIDTDFHVYSVVWEEDSIKWYVDGKCFFTANSDQWFSNAAPGNPRAPFDQEFYIIMNLAVGGWFDGGITPNPGDIPATMQVDYVRVYKPGEGSGVDKVAVNGITLDRTNVTLSSKGQVITLSKTITPNNATNKNVTWESSNPGVATVYDGKVTAVSNGTATITATTVDGGFKATCLVTVNIPNKPEDPVDPVDPVEPEEPVNPGQPTEFIVGDEVRGLKRINDNLEFYINGATFADLHYWINNGVQMNVAMNPTGNGNYKYLISNLKQNDKVEYFFTYNPGNGALDTERYTYIHGVTQGNQVPTNPVETTEYRDLAQGKNVMVSGSENDTLGPEKINDGNVATRWSSNWADDAWFVVDLGKTYNINQLILNWEAAFGSRYEILVSENGVNYTRVFTQNNGVGGVETINFNWTNARYVKFQGIQRGLPYGYSLFDIKVMGK